MVTAVLHHSKLNQILTPFSWNSVVFVFLFFFLPLMPFQSLLMDMWFARATDVIKYHSTAISCALRAQYNWFFVLAPAPPPVVDFWCCFHVKIFCHACTWMNFLAPDTSTHLQKIVFVGIDRKMRSNIMFVYRARWYGMMRFARIV